MDRGRRAGAPHARARLVGARRAGVRGHSRARSSLRPPGLSPLRSLCRMRTIWRRPPHGQAGIVSVRLGTVLQLTVPHAWQTSSATAAMSRGLPDPASSPSCNLRVLSLGGLEFRAICESVTSPEQPDYPAPASAKRGPAQSAFVTLPDAHWRSYIDTRGLSLRPLKPHHLNKPRRVSGRIAGGEARLDVRGFPRSRCRARSPWPPADCRARRAGRQPGGRAAARQHRPIRQSSIPPIGSSRAERAGVHATSPTLARQRSRALGGLAVIARPSCGSGAAASWGERTGDRAAGQKIRMMSRTTMAIATIAATMMYTPPGRPRPGRPSSGSPWRLTNSPFSSPSSVPRLMPGQPEVPPEEEPEPETPEPPSARTRRGACPHLGRAARARSTSTATQRRLRRSATGRCCHAQESIHSKPGDTAQRSRRRATNACAAPAGADDGGA